MPNNKSALGGFIIGLVSIGSLAMLTGNSQAHESNKTGVLETKFRSNNNGQVLLYWKGQMRKPMAASFRQAIDKWKARALGGFIISLNSRGGLVSEAYEVVDIVRRLKKTHDVRTYVARGNTCGSMCVPIFLTGNQRAAADASLWLFHDIAGRDKNDKTRLIVKPWKTDKMFNDYFIPAGVSQLWVDDIKWKIKGSDYWMTGGQLYSEKANIITNLRGNRAVRQFKVMARR